MKATRLISNKGEKRKVTTKRKSISEKAAMKTTAT